MNNPNEDILLTEDGHPIGELVMADATAVPKPPTESLVAENREALLRSSAAELTGNPDADAAVSELYPGYCDSDKKKKALELFVVDQKSIDAVATEVGVPGRTVSAWIYNGQWDVLARRDLAVRQSQSLLDLARLRTDKRLEIAKEQLEQAKAIRDKAMDNINDDVGSLKSNTEAWAAASKIEHTISGVSEAGTVAGIDGENEADKKDNGGKTPLVMIFEGGLPPIRKHV